MRHVEARRQAGGSAVVERMAAILAGYLARQLQLTKDQREVVQFGALALILHLLTFLLTSLFAWYFGILVETLVVILVVAGVRHFSGGPHVQRPGRCLITSTGSFLCLGFLGATIFRFFPVLPASTRFLAIACFLLISMFCLFRFAPAPPPNRPLRAEQAKRMRVRSLILGALIAGWVLEGVLSDSSLAPAGALGLLFQSLSLTPAGARAVNRLDSWFAAVEGRCLGEAASAPRSG